MGEFVLVGDDSIVILGCLLMERKASVTLCFPKPESPLQGDQANGVLKKRSWSYG